MIKCFIAVLFLAANFAIASGGTVVGKVLRQPPSSNAAQVNRYSGRNSIDKSKSVGNPESASAIVYLTGGNPGSAQPPTQHPRMVQQDQSFYPELLPILVGTTVDFPNLDPVFHNVFSYSKARRFDLGRYPKGQSKSVTFDTPGLVKVFCEIHSSMRAHILVLEQPYFTLAESDGSYRIANVPAGSYTLKVWQDQLPELEFPIVVTESDSVTVNAK